MDVSSTYICLFDLPPYDTKVAPALRRYAQKYDPAGVTALLQEAIALLPALAKETGRATSGREDFEHWADSIGPDAGYKPSEQTMHELCDMLIPVFCVPRGTGLNPMQEIERFVPWLSNRSEWFADLEDGGEELAGGRIEFSFGSGSLIATRQQIRQFLEEVRRVTGPPPELEPDYENLRRLLELADREQRYTLLKTNLKQTH